MNSSSSYKKANRDKLDIHSQTHPEKIGHLYDRLLHTESHQLTEKKLTIHKNLHFPQTPEFDGILDINDWLKSNIELADNVHILDAGCGVGGTLFSLIEEERTGIGITLSQKQLNVAQTEANSLGLNHQLKFLQQSYDDPLNEQFDIIISIEALAHSGNLSKSIDHLSCHLKSDGKLIIVEDMAPNEISSQDLAEIFIQSWHLGSIYTEEHYLKGLKSAGLIVMDSIDFSNFVRARSWPNWVLKSIWYITQKLPMVVKGSNDIFIGGLILEKLYAQNQMRYKILITQKSD